ncbi:MAG TPA: hypothetical protein PKC30_05180 [Saprospiraceae bacterium]|nr:hypothetical protein [Saprospiraceae bacterium]
MPKIIIGFLFLIFLSGCLEQDYIPHTIIHKAIDYHGGMESWELLDSLHYHKQSVLYFENGQTESEKSEYYQIKFHPTYSVKVVENDSVEILFDQNHYRKYLKASDKILSVTKQDTTNIESALFVIGQLFLLKEDSKLLTFEGTELISGVECFVVRADYSVQGKENHPWWYYISKYDYRLIASRVYHSPDYALIVNESYQKFQNILWNKERTTYRVDSLNAIQFIRAKYVYNFGEKGNM